MIALAGRRGGDRRGAAADRSRRARAPARGGRRSSPCASPGRAPAGRRASARPRARAGAIARAAASGCEGAATRMKRQRRNGAEATVVAPRPARGRARCRRGGARAPRRRTPPASVATAISRPSSRAEKSSIIGPMCSATSGGREHRRAGAARPRSATERRACSASPRISVASAASRRPPGVSAIPRPLRTNSSSPSSLLQGRRPRPTPRAR